MKITVLVDNNTLIDRYFFAEPGLSFLIEDDEIKVLFDTGYSDIFIRNAIKMGKDLTDLDYLILSHNHLDHTWGLEPLIKYFTELQLEKHPFKRPNVVAHPDGFISVSKGEFTEFGSLISESKLSKHFLIQHSKEPQQLNSRLTFLGEIPRLNDFESKMTFGQKEGIEEDDTVIDDSALIYQSKNGLVIITGCAHAGICNTIEYARRITGVDHVTDIVGGFHLQNPSSNQLEGTLAYLKSLQPDTVHACHCTDLRSKIALSAVVPLEEVGVGLQIEYES